MTVLSQSMQPNGALIAQDKALGVDDRHLVVAAP